MDCPLRLKSAGLPASWHRNQGEYVSSGSGMKQLKTISWVAMNRGTPENFVLLQYMWEVGLSAAGVCLFVVYHETNALDIGKLAWHQAAPFFHLQGPTRLYNYTRKGPNDSATLASGAKQYAVMLHCAVCKLWE